MQPILPHDLKLVLGHIRARRRDLASPLLDLNLVLRECEARNFGADAGGRWSALSTLLSDLALRRLSKARGMPVERIVELDETQGPAFTAALIADFTDMGKQPMRMAWSYVFHRFLGTSRVRHVDLNAWLRPDAKDRDGNSFWNHLKNETAVPLLAGALDEAERQAARSAAAGARGVPPALRPAPSITETIVGRGADMAAVRGHLEAGARLVSLVGPGGIGKTRLAQELARSAGPGFADGHVWVDLSRYAPGESILPGLGRDMALPGAAPSDAAALVAALRDWRRLIILNNAEPFLDALRALLPPVLEACPAARILATSRSPLKLPGEQVVRIGPLAVPPPTRADAAEGFEAVRLLVVEVRRVFPAFELDARSAPAAAGIVRALGGHPLAIKLVATFARAMTLPDMERRLATLLAQGAGPVSGLPPEHRTITACLEGSYRQLSPPQRQVFRQLAVFRGGWTAEAMQAVCRVDGRAVTEPEALELGLELYDRSLVDADLGGPTSRYRQHSLIRDHAARHLARAASGEEAAARERHTRFYVELAEGAAASFAATGGSAWLAALDPEAANLAAALAWADEQGDLESAVRLSGALWRYWARRGRSVEELARLEGRLALPGVPGLPPALQAAAHLAAGNLADHLDHLPRAEAYLRRAHGLISPEGPAEIRLSVLNNLANNLLRQRRVEEARLIYQDVLGMVGGAGPGRASAVVRQNLAHQNLVLCEYATAIAIATAAEHAYHALGDPRGQAMCMVIRAVAEQRRGRAALARRALLEAASIFADQEDALQEMVTWRIVCYLDRSHMDLDRARDCLGRARALESRVQLPLESLRLDIQEANLEHQAGQLAAAERRLLRALAAVDPAVNPDVAQEISQDLCWLYLSLEEPVSAMEYALAAIRAARSGLPPDQTVHLMETWASCAIHGEHDPDLLIAALEACATTSRAIGHQRAPLHARRCAALPAVPDPGPARPPGEVWRRRLEEAWARLLRSVDAVD